MNRRFEIPDFRFAVFGSRFSVLALLLTAYCSLLTSPAWAIRAVPWSPGKTVVVRAKPGQVTELILPAAVGHITEPDPQLISLRRLGDRIFIKPLGSFGYARVFIMDTEARSYLVELQEAALDEREDDSVEISLFVAEAPEDPIYAGPSKQLLRLFAAMMREKPLPGYQIVNRGGEVFFEELKRSRWRMLRVYEGPLMVGYVFEIENIAAEAIRVSPQQFKMKGYIAGSVDDERLAPHEPSDSVEAFKGYPKKTLAYAVADKRVIQGK